MLYTPPNEFAVKFANWDAAAVSPGDTVATHATPHTLSAWTEFTNGASLSEDIYQLVVVIYATAASAINSNLIVDIGIGAAASEVVLIDGLAGGYRRDHPDQGATYRIPIFIAKGTRLSFRVQSALASNSDWRIMAWGLGTQSRQTSVWHGGLVTSYGVNRSTSQGVSVTTGASDVLGSWTEIVASTTYRHSAMLIGVGGNADTTLSNVGARFQLGVGAGGSEVAIVDKLSFRTNSVESVHGIHPMSDFSLDIPAGTRLAIRSASSGTAASHDYILYGVS